MRLIKTEHSTRAVEGQIMTVDFEPPTPEAEVMFVEWVKGFEGRQLAVITWKVPRVRGKTKAELAARRLR